MNEELELERTDEDLSLKPRIYQEQLLEQALKENVIIYLPTGAGKTFIALMALKRMSKDLNGTLAEGGKRTVFLTNTVALARQQFEVTKKFINLKVGLYTGDLNVDNWKRDKWEIELNKYQVLVSTTQIILDIIRHKYISINQFNLLIFDECHNATKGHVMLQLMSQFADANQKELPRVIGLTGILLKASKDNIIEELNNLEAVFRAKIITVATFDDFQNVLLYSTKPNEIVVPFDDVSCNFRIKNTIEHLIFECISTFKKCKVDVSHYTLSKNLASLRLINPIKKMENLLQDFLYQLEDLGPYGGYIAMLSVLVEVELKKRRAETIAYKNMCRIVISYTERILHLIKSCIYDPDDEDETELDVIYNSSSSKVTALLMYLKKEFFGKKSEDIKCLIFVQRRHTAKNLYHIISNFAKHVEIPVKPNFMVGAHDVLPESIECILTTKCNRNILNEFQKNECNLIVASSVLEEGIDIQSCNYVIIYDQLKSFVSYIQTKGRARMQNSTYAMLMPSSKKNLLVSNIKKYQSIDKALKDYLISKTLDRNIPLQSETDKQFQTLIQPFYSKIGAKLEADGAVSLCARYCNILPNDTFTISAPQYSKIDHKESTVKIVKLILPLQSSIKDEIISDEMPTIKWAKRSAAFKACKILYENGELNDHLIPISKKKCLEQVQHVYFKEWENYPNDNKFSAGTKKNRRIHDICFPKQLCSNIPLLGEVAYLYIIQIIPKFEREIENYHVFDCLVNKSNYAILLRHKLPKIASMPLFMSQGQVTVSISNYGYEVVIYNQEEYLKLRNFNTMIFRKLIGDTWSSNFSEDFRNEENSFIIVPTTNKNKIDWELVENFQNLSDITKTIEIQRKNMIIKPESYLNKLVATWYTADDSVRYIVTKIRDDLNPLSPFPNEQHQSFVTYLQEKWGQKVIQTNSFLLEVEPLTSRINFLTYNEEKKKSKRKFNSILLVPELVHNFNFPGHFYLKARFLPSILFRLNYILISEELRISLNKFLNFSSEDYNPQSLIVDKTLERVKKIEKCKEIFKNIDEECSDGKKLKRIENRFAQLYNWKEYEEPCDINRNLQSLYKVEIDYYHYFINQEFQKLNLNSEDQFAANNIFITEEGKNLSSTSRNAICDVSLDQKKFINILAINENSIRSPEQWEILASITAAGANDVFDSERLEVLGDSFLKFSISLWLLHKHPIWNEGYLTEVKGQFVSNRNLLYHAIKMNIPGILCSRPFKPTSEWKPPSINIPLNAAQTVCRDKISPSVFNELELDIEEINSGKCKEKTLLDFQAKFVNYENESSFESDMSFLVNKVWIADKICADAVEALLGVCVKYYGIEKSFLLLEYFNILPKTENLKNLLNLDLGNPRLKTNITDKEVDDFLMNYQQLENNLGYKFKDRAYLLQALTHPSYPTNRITGCYQQLEFIGDAILDFLITMYIFERCNDMDPGKITDLRSALVNNVTLACLCVRHKFHLFLLSQNAALSQSIIKFVEFQEQNNFKITDQVRILALESEIKTIMADYINVPKTLGDIFEALIGAIFLDSGNNLKVVWNVIFNLMSIEIFEFMANVPIQIIRQLYEYHGADPIFDDPVVEEDIVMMKCTFTCRNERIEVFGFGSNKNEAKMSASKSALQHLFNS